MFFVALFARAWIEITNACVVHFKSDVALFARAWIEIISGTLTVGNIISRPLCEGVD